ncbi:ABC-type transporter periplasmic protein [Psychromonas sp. CNPT3]|uniref:MlaC/ttg2D family ABC transporter substrate-binding protein n=1 Tax=Psychromonas sp. CNPT3 TaxID=314282 RepID=UPI00006E9CCF|nr:ABC transporter substrate-binding protein [Psychromonas sp. CNPT3]AGH81888.1 ABC-type transporter periplasmic protein [Psychromonas sp. CNPT3]
MRILLSAVLLLFTSMVSSQSIDMSNPNTVIKEVSRQTFARLERDATLLKNDPTLIKKVIAEQLLPYFDYKYAAYKVMGVHLRETSKAQRQHFVNAFKEYLVNAYGHLLMGFKNQQLKIIEVSNFSSKRIITIPVRVTDEAQQVTKIAFKLRKNKKTGQWKVFDVMAEGISMLQTKQSELTGLIQKKGIDHVIDLLETKNTEFSS